MHDNKVRLSQDVLEKAERIAAEWGLKNSRAAVEAVFRRYCDDYLYGRPGGLPDSSSRLVMGEDRAPKYTGLGPEQARPSSPSSTPRASQCEALDALDQLLAL